MVYYLFVIGDIHNVLIRLQQLQSPMLKYTGIKNHLLLPQSIIIDTEYLTDVGLNIRVRQDLQQINYNENYQVLSPLCRYIAFV